MYYVLLNRNNIIVDILTNYIRYIKLQISNNIIIGCSKSEGTGVIGSDCNTHYVLAKADMTNSPEAITILELESIPDNIKPNLYRYDYESQSFVYLYTLDEAKELKQEENKEKFSSYLDSHPLIWNDGKQYGITMEDQSEISLNITQYQLAATAGTSTPILEWHAKHEACQPWTLEDLTTLSMAISSAVYPYYRKMQQYKIEIYAASSIEELDKIELTYEEENT